MSSIIRILSDARKNLEEKGWVQRNFETPAGYCIMGAVRQAMFGSSAMPTFKPDLAVYGDVLDRLRQETARPMALTMWNDHPERTKEQVLALFDATIQKALK